MKNFILPMLGVQEQILGRGAVNASFTQVNATGVEKATRTLFDKVLDILNKRPITQDALGELDHLRPQRLTPLAINRLAGLEELAEPTLDEDELKRRFDTLRMLQTGMANRLSRDAANAADAPVDETARKFRDSVEQTFVVRPNEAPALIEQARTALANFTYPPPDGQPLQRLKRLMRALDDLMARRASLAKKTYEVVRAQLLAKARSAYVAALAAYASDLVGKAVQRAVLDVNAFLDEMTRKAAAFRSRADQIAAALADREKSAAERHKVSRASAILILDGPDENQVLTGMLERNRAADANQLAGHMLDRFEAALRTYAQTHCPTIDAQLASLVKLILAILPVDVADQFVQVVGAALGGGHTLFELIEQHGVDATAHYLFQRAEHTCHLTERNNEIYNVPSVELTIVRLPPPVGPRDHGIREQLRNTFANLSDCLFAEDENDYAVTVIRLELGWPIGIEQANRALLQRYLRSGDQGHLPHLLDILPESPLGAICDEYRTLLD